MSAVPLQKTYDYKCYSPSGSYLGTIPRSQIISDFGYNQNIATTFAQMTVLVALDTDVASQPVDFITDESGNPLTDENGNNLVIERQPDNVGSTNSKNLIANNNLIKVYEYSNYYPNGILVFSGYISKWKTNYGGSNEGQVELTCLSNGNDMKDVLVTSGDSVVINQNSDDGSSFTSTNAGFGQWILQTFSLATAYQISGISLELTATVQAQLQIEIKQQISTSPNPGSDPIVASGTVTVPVQTKTVTKVSFTNPTTLNPQYTYYIQILWQDTSNLTIFSKAGQPYGGGNVYTLTSSGTYFLNPVLQAGYSLYFLTYQHGGSVTGAYVNTDPSYMLTDVMNNYTSQGGLITQPVSTLNPVVSQSYGDSNIPGAYWSCAFAQVLQSATNLTFDTIQIKLPIGTTSLSGFQSPSLYKGSPASDSVTVISGSGSYSTSNPQVSLPAVASTSVNPNNGLATIVFASPITLTGGQAYYLQWFFNQGAFTNGLQGVSTIDPTVSSPFGAIYSGLVLANNTSAGMATVTGVQAAYLILALGAGSSPNGGYSNTGQLATYTFKMNNTLSALQAILALAPANWYWYVDPADGSLHFSIANTVADFTVIKGRHIDEIDIEATKENIKNIAYFTGGDDGTGTNTSILTKVTTAQGSNRLGLALLSDNRVTSTTGGTVTAKLISQNYLNNNSSETYITNLIIQDQTMDINLIKLGMMCGFAGFGNFVDNLLLQVVGITRTPDQVTLQLGSLPKRDSQVVAALNAALQATQTGNVPSVPS
jgi:hypothetical protein